MLVVHDQALVIGWTGTDLRLNYAYSFDTLGRYWSPAITLPDHSFYRPTLSTIDGDFTISWTDLADNRYRTWSITNQTYESNPDEMNFDAPSEAVDDGFPPASYLGIARTDMPTEIVYVFSSEFGDSEIAVGQSLWAPSLAADEIPDNNHFYVAWLGVDGYLHYDVLWGSAAPNQGATSQDGPAWATPNGQQNVAWAATEHQLQVLDQANGIRPLGGPINVTSPNAPSLAADRDLYFAWMDRNAQIQTREVNERAVRNTDESNHNSPSRAIDVGGTRRTAWTSAEDGFSAISW